MKTYLIGIVAILWSSAAFGQQASATEDILEVLENQFDKFRTSAHNLSAHAQNLCEGGSQENFLDQLNITRQAWAPLDSYQFGPVEQQAVALSVNFWPDTKNFTGRAIRNILSADQADQARGEFIEAQSAAGQGFPALELLTTEEALPACPAIIGISGHVADMAESVYAAWFEVDGWADLARNAGPDNPIYRDEDEFLKEIVSAIDFGLERVADQRLGRPLGRFDRPFPKRAEAWRSGQSLPLITAQLEGLQRLMLEGYGEYISEESVDELAQAASQALMAVENIELPLDQAVMSPENYIRVENAQSRIKVLQEKFVNIAEDELSLGTGFTAADGD